MGIVLLAQRWGAARIALRRRMATAREPSRRAPVYRRWPTLMPSARSTAVSYWRMRQLTRIRAVIAIVAARTRSMDRGCTRTAARCIRTCRPVPRETRSAGAACWHWEFPEAWCRVLRQWCCCWQRWRSTRPPTDVAGRRFSVGLALTLTAVGLAFLYARSRIRRSIVAPRWTQLVPVMSAAAITLLGALLCYGALTGGQNY